MKRAKLIFKFYKGHWKMMLIVSVVFTITVLYILFAFSDIASYEKSLQMYEKANLSGSVYYIQSGGIEEPYSEPNVKALEKMPGIEDVIYIKYIRFLSGSNIYNAFIFPDSTIDAFPIEVNLGNKLTDFTDPQENNGNTINALLCGKAFDNISLNQKIEVVDITTGTLVNLIASGKTREALPLPQFGFSGSVISTDNLFLIADYSNNVILLRERDFSKLRNVKSQYSGLGCFIRFKLDGNEKSILETKNILGRNARLFDFKNIVVQGKRDWNLHLKEELIYPIILIFASLMVFMTAFIVIADARSNEFKIYCLCGYTVKSAFKAFLISMVTPAFFSILLVLLFLALLFSECGYIVRFFLFNGLTPDIDPVSVILLIIYLALYISLSILCGKKIFVESIQ